MNLSFGGSLGKAFKGFSSKFNKSESFWGKWGRGLTTNLAQMRTDLTKAGGGTIGEQLLHRPMREGEFQTDFNKGLKNIHKSTMGWSRQLSPLWEGGLSGTGGSLHQDLLPWMEDLGMKGSHMLAGTKYFADKDGSSGSGGSGATVDDSEDPSLINQGNWVAANQMETLKRRGIGEIKAGGYHDRAKDTRGRKHVKDIA